MHREQLDAIVDRMAASIARGWVPGVVLQLVHRGEVVLQQGLGMADLEAGTPMAADTIFRLASMTKPVTAVAVLMLYEAGELQLADPIGRFLPAFHNAEITIHRLLTHTSGVQKGPPGGDVARAYDAANPYGQDLPIREVADRLAGLPLASVPGTQYAYDPAGYRILSALVEEIGGQTFDRFLQERIFDPLRMADSGYRVSASAGTRLAGHSRYLADGDFERIDNGRPNRADVPNPLASGSGGLYGTVGDYARFGQMLERAGTLDGVRLLGPRTVDLMCRDHLSHDLLPLRMPEYPDIAPGYSQALGLGVLIDPVAAGYPGAPGEIMWTGSNGTYFFVDAREQLVGLLMYQMEPSRHLPLRRQFRVMAYAGLER